MICSRSLLTTDVKETGLLFEAVLRAPFLKMGVMSASRQSSGTVLALREVWKMRVSIGAISSDAKRNSRLGMPSGPEALWGF